MFTARYGLSPYRPHRATLCSSLRARDQVSHRYNKIIYSPCIGKLGPICHFQQHLTERGKQPETKFCILSHSRGDPGHLIYRWGMCSGNIHRFLDMISFLFYSMPPPPTVSLQHAFFSARHQNSPPSPKHPPTSHKFAHLHYRTHHQRSHKSGKHDGAILQPQSGQTVPSSGYVVIRLSVPLLYPLPS